MSKNEKESQPAKEDTTLDKINKFFTVANSKFGVRVFAVTTLSLALAGIAAPFVPVAAPAILIAGLASVAVGVIADTFQVRNLMALQKESTLLLKAQASKLAQDKILEQNPTLKNILGDKLSAPARNNEKSTTERYNNPNSPRSWLSKATDVTAALNSNFGIISTFVKSASKGDQKSVSEALATAFYSLVSSAERKTQTNSVRNVLENQIDGLRGQSNTPGYNDLDELKSNAREQRIQQLALQKLVTEYPELIKQTIKSYPGSHRVNPQKLQEQIQKKFEELKEEVASKEKAVSNRPFTSEVKSWGKALQKAHNPFSQYYDPNVGKVEISRINPKTNQVEKVQFKVLEKAKEVEKAKETKAAEKAKKTEKKAKKEAKFEKKVDERVKKLMGKIDSHRDNRKSSSKAKPPHKSNKKNKGTNSRGK